MKITHLKTNHLTNPLGYGIEKPVFSFLTSETQAKHQKAAQIQIAVNENFCDIVFDSGKSPDVDSLAYAPDIIIAPCTRYWWRVQVWADNGDYAISDAAWFETAKVPGDWQAKWITHTFEQGRPAVFRKKFRAEKAVVSARAYIVGLGLYEVSLNGQKIGEEYLTPGCHAYDKWIQYQTYDVTTDLEKENEIAVTVADGWYRGRFGYQGQTEIYGEEVALLAEFVLNYADGTKETICSDDSWKVEKSGIIFANIYDGEWYDARFSESLDYPVKVLDLGYDRLQARLNPPVVANEHMVPKEIITTSAGETVLDMGQNMVGWLEARFDEPVGTEVLLKFGEILQDGKFYQDNFRTAKQEYRFISDGVPRTVRQHFTFYGFRFVKISGMTKSVEKKNFTGIVLHSQMDRVGTIETSDPLVNRLFLNALWGQKGNFVDVPTDCPQRDERMGWTGDAQAFSGTACFNMDTYAFYTKYGRDLAYEQKSLHGAVPFVVPMAGMHEGGSTAWGEAATVIPWNVYLHSGDKTILENQFDSMKAWVDYIRIADKADGEKHLWMRGFHFADWLALDNYADPDSSFGGTDNYFIASAYYCYSAELVSKAAHVLGRSEDEKEYRKLTAQIRDAICKEYLTQNGRLAIDTQTAYVIALFMDLVPDDLRERIVADLREKLRKNGWKLTTGFVGTTYLCRVLSENGCNDVAYTLLMNRDYPSWIYEVLMGATTIWERWNSVLPDGSISSTGMNSLNHYTYGSIVEWMYRDMMGFVPSEKYPGFRKITLSPKPDYRLQWAKASIDTVSGQFVSSWNIQEGSLKFEFTIPYNTEAKIILPDACFETVKVGSVPLAESGLVTEQCGDTVVIDVESGEYKFFYQPQRPYTQKYDIYSCTKVLMTNSVTRKIVIEAIPDLLDMTDLAGNSLPLEDSEEPFCQLLLRLCNQLPCHVLENLNQQLKKVACD